MLTRWPKKKRGIPYKIRTEAWKDISVLQMPIMLKYEGDPVFENECVNKN